MLDLLEVGQQLLLLIDKRLEAIQLHLHFIYLSLESLDLLIRWPRLIKQIYDILLHLLATVIVAWPVV